jgi:hypothetical protein
MKRLRSHHSEIRGRGTTGQSIAIDGGQTIALDGGL